MPDIEAQASVPEDEDIKGKVSDVAVTMMQRANMSS
jgi:hypothetical protein